MGLKRVRHDWACIHCFTSSRYLRRNPRGIPYLSCPILCWNPIWHIWHSWLALFFFAFLSGSLCSWKVVEWFLRFSVDEWLSFERLMDCKLKFSSATQFCLTLCDPMDCNTPGFPVHHQFPELAQTHVHRVGNTIQPSCLLSFPSPSACNLSQHQGLFQWVSSLHQVAKVLECQLQHQSFQWIFKTNFLQDWLVGSPCSSSDFQQSSPTPQFKSIQ